MIEKSVINGLVENPSEALTVETKRWIDPNQSAGAEKIVKGTLALRNRDGGFFVIGFDDATLAPDLANRPQDVKALFHVDVIQGLISKYASEPFEIEVAWGERDGADYPVIAVPSGVKTPVAAKRDLSDGGRSFIKLGAVYFRSLSSNGTPSTTEARPSDWADIVEICFNNREADVGRFLRRHLAGLDTSSLMRLLEKPAMPTPTVGERAVKLIDAGEARFSQAINARSLSAEEKQMLSLGFWSVSLVIDPPHADAVPTQEFLAAVGASNPNYTGWPIWLDARFVSDSASRPKVTGSAFEYLIVSLSQNFSNHIDFARLDPKGEFFLHRLLQDDGAPSQIRPGRVIDPILMVLRVAEAMGVGIAFAKALGWVPDQATLGFAFRWHGLSGRRLNAWANAFFAAPGGGTAHDSTVESCVQLSLDTPLSALAPFVDDATKRLFAAFDGTIVPRQTIEEFVRRLFERKL